MKALKDNLGLLILCAIELAIGIVFFTDPVQFTSAVLTGVGAVLLAAGVWYVALYFTTQPAMAALEQHLTRGIISCLLGGLLLFRNDLVVAVFPLLTQVYGVVILVAGTIKLQRGVDLLRLKQRFWGLPLISAALALALGTLILADPFESTLVLWRICAGALIVQAALDLVVLIFAIRDAGQDVRVV